MTDIQKPIVVVCGKARRKRLRQLARGEGRLVEEIAEVLDLVQEDLGEGAENKEQVPVVLIYKRKRKRNRGLFG